MRSGGGQGSLKQLETSWRHGRTATFECVYRMQAMAAGRTDVHPAACMCFSGTRWVDSSQETLPPARHTTAVQSLTCGQTAVLAVPNLTVVVQAMSVWVQVWFLSDLSLGKFSRDVCHRSAAGKQLDIRVENRRQATVIGCEWHVKQRPHIWCRVF